MKKLALISVLPQIEAELNTAIKKLAQTKSKYDKNQLSMPFIELSGASRFSARLKIILIENRQSKIFESSYKDQATFDKVNKLRSLLIENNMSDAEISQIRSLNSYLTDIIKNAGFKPYNLTRTCMRDNGYIKVPVFVRLSLTDGMPSLRKKQYFKVRRELYNILTEKAKYLNLDIDTVIATYYEVCMSERNALLIEAKQEGGDYRYSDFNTKELERESFVKVENLIKLIDHFTY